MKPPPDLRQRAQAWIGQGVEDIDTPSLVIDLDAMERNLARMAAFARERGLRLRPHAKMHKSAELSRLQMAHGAVGVCVQKTDEALRLAAVMEENSMFQYVKQLAPYFQVQRNASDRHRFDVLVPVNVVPGLHVIASNIQAGTQFDTVTV